MSSKRFVTSCLIAATLLSSLACDRFLKSAQSAEEKAKQETFVLDAGELTCLKKLPAKIRNYAEDAATAEDVDSVYTCFNQAIDTFQRYYNLKEDQFSSENLRNFFNRYLLKENEISKDFMREILKVKTLIFGGSPDSLTRAEIGQILKFASSFRDQAQILRGNFRILLFKSTDQVGEVDPARLADLRGKVRKVVLTLLGETKVAGSLYEFKDFAEFVRELHGFLNTNEGFEKFAQYLPLAEALKNLFVGERAQMRTMRDWQTTLNWSVDVYFEALNYNYRIRRWNFDKAQTSQELVDTIGHVLDLLENAPVFTFFGRMDAEMIDRALDAAAEKNLLGKFATLETLKSSYRMLLLRVLDRDSQGLIESATGIEKRHLSVLRFEYRAWQLSQDFLTKAFKDSDPKGILKSDLDKMLDAQDAKSKISSWKDVVDTATMLQTWNDWKGILQRPRPLQWTSAADVLMMPDPSAACSGLKGLTIMNALRSAIRLFLRGYGQGDSRDIWALRWAEKDLIRLEKDFHEVAIALKFIDPRSVNPAGRTFKEANFFTYAGNGNEWLDSQEIFEEINLLVAVGNNIAKKTQNLALADGCGLEEKDIFGLQKLKDDCLSRVLRTNFENLMLGLPKMRALVAKMDDKQWAAFYRDISRVANLKEHEEGVTEYGELRTGLVVLHYVEGLMMTYDVNKDDRLQQKEIEAASPRFRSFIATQSPVGDFLVDDIFLYIVYRGKKPKLGDAVDLVGFQFEKAGGLREINRQDLLNVLAILKEDASK